MKETKTAPIVPPKIERPIENGSEKDRSNLPNSRYWPKETTVIKAPKMAEKYCRNIFLNCTKSIIIIYWSNDSHNLRRQSPILKPDAANSRQVDAVVMQVFFVA